MNRKLVWAIVVLLCVCVVVAGIGVWGFSFASQATPTNIARATATRLILDERRTPVIVPTIPPPNQPTLVAPTATRVPPVTPLVAVSIDTATALDRTLIPSRNLYEITPRLRKNLTLLTPVPTPVARLRQVGQRENFFVSEDMATGKYRTVPATLQIVSQRAYVWVEDGITTDLVALKRAADVFDTKIYPTNEKYFGSPKAGLDGDSRIHILNARFQDAAGYFSSVDMHPIGISQYSNQRNIIFMNSDAVKPGDSEYQADLAHEFQHLIHHYQARYATGWIDEGMAQLATKVNGYPVGGVINNFGRTPNTQLNTWATGQDALAHYGAAYIFFGYIADRFGADAIRDVMLAPREGIGAVQTMLDRRANGMRVDELFADWAIANYVNDLGVAGNKYAHPSEGAFRITREPVLNAYPDVRTNQQREYAANYFTLQPAVGDVTVYFTGTTTAKLIAADAHSGRWVWYSNRADLANMTLTREVDLTRVSGRATLRFWTWFDIEKDYDYGYVEVSSDGGKTWDILPGKNTVTTNLNGANFGAGLTGKSGVKDDALPAQWTQEEMDLSAYAGKRVLLRFEYITDDAYNTPGWAIDDITIPEAAFTDTIESGASGWDAKGFLRSDNVLPQKYIVQVIEQGATTRVKRVTLDAQNRGNYTIAGFGKDVTKATLVIAAFAPTTTEPTEYQFGVAPK
ncbi:MAG: immune inhibitor A [Chloroflexi bacterium]|nr:immune inhibitor A [Chloroflexota bacterium]